MSNYLERYGVPWLFGQDQGVLCYAYPLAIVSIAIAMGDGAESVIGPRLSGRSIEDALRGAHPDALCFLLGAVERARVFKIVRSRRPRRCDLEVLRGVIAELDDQPVWFVEWLRWKSEEWDLLADILGEVDDEGVIGGQCDGRGGPGADASAQTRHRPGAEELLAQLKTIKNIRR